MERTALVTGANRGIGLALCRRLKERGRDVIAVCRKSSPELDALGVRVEAGVDVTSDDAVSGLARRLTGVALDEIICNAGILREDGLDDGAYSEIRAQMEVNAIAPVRVVAALRRNLRRGGKIALITSRMGSIGDNGSGGYYGYRMSKAALNAAGMSLARDLAPSGIAVAILHPGFVRTQMTEGSGNIDPDEAAAQLVDRLEALSLETTGTFWHANGQVLPW
ncbi:MAG TPA: SDR family oxidoreductase [Polyangia bacterium]|jgi:NAD(P)-dependent dehydrogenase (short-subunit alcohol dehydrogenase family)